MVELYPYPRFSLAERDRRWRAVRERMRQQNIDVIIVPNNTGHSTDFQSNARYLSHVGGGGDADIAVVFPLEGDITAIATSAAARWPTVQDWTTDVREARRRYGKVAAERLKELKAEKGRIGITGLGGGTRSPEGTISHNFWVQIRENCPQADIVDATQLLTEVRYIKSAEEIEVLTKSIAIIEEGVAAEIASAKPGATDWEVWAATLYAMMRNGSELPVHCNWVSGKNPVRTLTRPSMRVLERGDLIINELEASWIGYRAQAVQPVFVQVADPTHEELFKVQREIFNELMLHLRPGVTVKELAERTDAAARRAAPRQGPAADAKPILTMHGRGAGDDGPIITRTARDPEQLAVALQENMVFVFKPSATTADGKSICTWGDTIVVTPQGGRRLGQRPHALAVAS
ncbi:MAG TPA: M24 family metallopeptidase [Xanthobacteraceae bacterium]|nr:M24 family metallopeptidase [Xanthobacteraceae bacterium]